MAKPSAGTVSLATRFHARFSGLDRAYGEYTIPKHAKPDERGKIQGHGKTINKPLTVNHWERHLNGELSIGVIPVNDNDTTNFGAIDVDVYLNMDLDKISRELIRLELPLILIRSKSGGPQLYLFTSEQVPAELIQSKLMEWAVLLGYSGVEIFPKQVRLAGPKDIGNWINMPYYAGAKTTRYAIFDGKKLTAEQFLETADLMAVTKDQLSKYKIETVVEEYKEVLAEAPPCLQCLANSGFPEGGRNKALFCLGVYARKRHGDDDLEQKLDEYNRTFFPKPLGHREVGQIVKNVKKKDYAYLCQEQPMSGVCNRQICLTRKFGIGTAEGDPGVVFGGLSKINSSPPTWVVEVNGKRFYIDTAQLKDQARFHTRCIEEINIWPMTVKGPKWAEMVRNLLANCEVIEVPEDATPEGQLWGLLEEFCNGRQQAKTRDEIRKKPWTPTERTRGEANVVIGRTYFTSTSFRAFLEQYRFRVSNDRQIWNWLKDRGAEHGAWNIKNRTVNWWSVPSFPTQNEDFSVPELDMEM